MDAFDMIFTRRSTRNFKPELVEREKLEKIIEAGHEVVLVVTQPDKPKGRSGELSPCDVKVCALEHNIPVFQPVKIKQPEHVEYLKTIDADIFVVAAFGQILSQEILDIPRFGCVNIHASILPEYRGAAPIQQAIIDGKKTTGVTIMQMAAGMDTGDILLQRTIKIDEEETGGSLFDKLSKLGGELIVEALPKIERGEITPVPQDEALATKCGKLSKDMGRIDFSEDADSIRNLIRGLNPWPSAFTSLGGKMLKIWHAKALSPVDFGALCNSLSPEDGARTKEIANTKAYGSIIAVLKDSFVVLTGDGYLRITEVQLEGKKRMDVKSFLLGNKLEIGTVLK